MKPIVGVMPLWDDDKESIWMLPGYMDGLNRAGAVPFIFPFSADEGELAQLAEFGDGFLFTGGHDVSPRLYHEQPMEGLVISCEKRDRMETVVLRLAMAADKPVLGICRGIQLINAALGGTLYQDIETQLKEAIKHPCYNQPRDKVHEVTVIEDSLVYRMTGLKRFSVNSRHHQGIKRLGHGLVATAYSKDGLIEAFDYPAEKFVTAVQWHPESLSDRFPEAQAIFNAFAEACDK